MIYPKPPFGFVLGMVLAACLSARGQSQSRQIKLQPAQVYTNEATQFQFPPNVAEFQRESELTQYDPEGRDIGIGYNDVRHNIAATVFVYPISQRSPNDTLKGHFETCKTEVLRAHAEAKLVAEGRVKMSPAGRKVEGLHAAFTSTEVFAHQRQSLRSELFLFMHRRFFILFRVTYPVGQQASAEPTLKAFIDNLPWP